MSEDSPLVDIDEATSSQKKKGGENGEGLSPGTLKTIAYVVTLIVIILILYYAVSCYSSNSKPSKLKKSKKKTKDICDNFDVEQEVQKLRIKQDELRARM